ncbi:MAG TPA: prolyl oligopeptidase family serine peptidase [Chiayiivirga sp.]|nr:prolyl oligopeptidase family serine peptidase [Chiayiivirga sp.]
MFPVCIAISRLALLLFIATSALAVHAAEPLTMEKIMADPDWIGAPVERAWWALDGKSVLHEQKRVGSPLRDLHVTALKDGASRVAGDAERAGLDAADAVFDLRRERALFVRDGDLFLRELRDGRLVQLSRGMNASGAQFSADQRQAQFRSGDDWYAVDLASRLVHPVAQPKAEKDPAAEPKADDLRALQLELIATLAKRRADTEARRARDAELRKADATRAGVPVYLGDEVKIARSALSPDGRWLLVVTEPRNGDKGRAGKMPVYVTESGYEDVEDVRTRVGRNPPAGHTLRRVELATGKVETLTFDALPGIDVDPLADLRKAAGKDALKGQRPVRIDAIRFSDDGSRAAVQLRATDNKDRWIARAAATGTALVPLHRLTDAAWINWNFNDFGWLPDNRTLWLLSEESGYSHLYTVGEKGGRARALTQGAWEVSSPQLSPDGSRFFFLCNRAWPGDYEVCDKALGKSAVRELTALDGVEDFSVSPDGKQLLVRHSSTYVPAQISVLPATGGQARALTQTVNPDFAAYPWIAPRIEQVPSTQVKAPLWSKFYRPETLEPGKTYPIVLFVHGAGYTQNTHARYPYYFREQMFNNLLVQQGYLVLDIDYRASEGYGRDWRTAIYRRFGEPELQDLIDGVNWLVAEHQGDAGRVGVYGGSYGGFMSLIAMFKAPEVFHAGAALRPVTDWTQYNHGYTANILNTPDIDPAGYRSGSPIFFAEGLKGDLLIAHGMMDDNVFYQDSVRLAQRLIELKKERWELASYPLERHGFVEPDAWLDEYRRIFALFERSIGAKAADGER